MTDLRAVSGGLSDSDDPGAETRRCVRCRKPAQYRAAEERWVHAESLLHQCEPGSSDSTTVWVIPDGMRLVRRTRTTVLGPDGHRPA